jgi:SAM-dependent methyltransferase
MTATADLPHPRFARMYLKTSSKAEQRGATDHLRRLLEGLAGTVVEVGAGHGLNFAHYPTTVTEVVAIEPEPTLRAAATEVAASAPVPIRVLAGVADELPLENESVDAAVTSLVLCSVPDQDRDHSGLWPRIAGGCHPARDTGAAITRAGFSIESSERIMFAASRLEPSIPHILGVARRS